MKTRQLVKTSDRGIYKRGGRYVVVYRDDQGRQRKQSAATLAEARDVKAAMRTDVARGEYREVSRKTFGEYAEDWCRTRVVEPATASLLAVTALPLDAISPSALSAGYGVQSQFVPRGTESPSATIDHARDAEEPPVETAVVAAAVLVENTAGCVEDFPQPLEAHASAPSPDYPRSRGGLCSSHSS